MCSPITVVASTLGVLLAACSSGGGPAAEQQRAVGGISVPDGAGQVAVNLDGVWSSASVAITAGNGRSFFDAWAHSLTIGGGAAQLRDGFSLLQSDLEVYGTVTDYVNIADGRVVLVGYTLRTPTATGRYAIALGTTADPDALHGRGYMSVAPHTDPVVGLLECWVDGVLRRSP